MLAGIGGDSVGAIPCGCGNADVLLIGLFGRAIVACGRLGLQTITGANCSQIVHHLILISNLN